MKREAEPDQPAAKRPRVPSGPTGPGDIAEVRFDTAESAVQAVEKGNGSLLGSTAITVEMDPKSHDGTKILVTNMPSGIGWQDLKEHFASAGAVQFCTVHKKAQQVQAQGPPRMGEVRFEAAADASVAMKSLNGSQIGGVGPQIWIQADPSSQDGSKLIVHGVAAGTKWQELKDHFATVGAVAYAKLGAPELSQLQPQPQLSQPQPQPQPQLLFGGRKGGAARQPAPTPYGYVPMIMSQPMMVQQPRAPVKGMIGTNPVGEVRFEHPAHAQMAAAQLNGTQVQGRILTVQLDNSSMDGSKLLVFGLPPSCPWQELKALASTIGPVAFATVKQGGGPEIVQQQRQQRMSQPLWPRAPLAAPGGKGFAPAGPSRARARPEGPQTAEVRFERPDMAEQAVSQLDGSLLGGSTITVTLDPKSQDASKVIISNVDPSIGWQEVKDHCAQIGTVAFATVVGPGEVRYETAEHAQQAITDLTGAVIEGYRITVTLDPNSQDQTKVIIANLPPAVKWQELKDFFACIGPVSYAARAGAR